MYENNKYMCMWRYYWISEHIHCFRCYQPTQTTTAGSIFRENYASLWYHGLNSKQCHGDIKNQYQQRQGESLIFFFKWKWIKKIKTKQKK